MLKILLIDEEYPYLKKELRDLEPILPPTGLMYMSAYLKDKLKNKVEVKIVKRVLDCLSVPRLLNILRDYSPDVVGVRGMSIFARQFHNTAKTIKSYSRNVIIAAGGPYITMDLKEAAKDKNIDYFVFGEGEITFTELIKKLLKKQKPQGIKGLAYRKEGKLMVNAPRPFIEDLDCLPFPDYNLISVDKYSKVASFNFNKKKQACIFSSRGCPRKCIYCSRFLGDKLRLRSAQNVFKEIEQLYKKFQIKDFYFLDGWLNYSRTMDIFNLIISKKMQIHIYLINGPCGDSIDKAFIDKMVEAGVIWVSYAVETASPRLQKLIKKFLNLDKLAENISYTCKKGIMVSCGAMVGFPTETKKEALQTIDYIKQFKKIVMASYSAVRYFPNTKMHDLALEEGIGLDTIRKAYGKLFCEAKFSWTPSLSQKDFRNLNIKFLKEVCLSKKRLYNAIEIQKKFYNQKEILNFYSVLFQKKINNLNKEILSYAQ